MNLSERLTNLRSTLLPGSSADEDTEKRSANRNRRAAFTSGTAVLARVVQVGTSLITVPLTIHYLGNERFGLWMTISSVLAMANFADFGIGNGVLNTVSKAFGKDDFDEIRRVISSGFAVLGAVALVVMALVGLSFVFVPWADVFRVASPAARAEATPALIVFAACFALNIPLDVVQRVQLGIQEGFRTNLWQIGGSVLGLAGIVAGIHARVGLPLLVLAFAGSPVVAAALNSIHFFFFDRADLRPKLKLVRRDTISQIATLGAQFFILQLIVAIAFSADNVVIARVLGAVNVPDYSVPQRMFSLISLFFAMMVAPLWPAYGEAVSRGDMSWVRRTLTRSLLLVFAGAAASSAVLVLVGRWLIGWWVGPQIHVSFVLLLGLAIWTVLDCSGNALAMFLNGASIMRFQMFVAPVFGVSCLIVKVLMTRRYGIVAVPWATALTYLAVPVVASVIYVPRALKRLHAIHSDVVVATPVHTVAEE